jgi:hypothetical protein
MKKLCYVSILMGLLSQVHAQNLVNSDKRNRLQNHTLTIDLGSIRLKYPYPITEIGYSSPLLKKVNLKFSGRIRSYGTWYFFSKSGYDITPTIEYYFTKKLKPVYFSVGLGLDTRIRLSNDERSEAKTSAEPMIIGGIHGRYKNFTYSMPFWNRYYSNGISFSFLPEVAYQVSPRLSLFFRYELNLLAIYKTSSFEVQQDCFIGTHIYF